MLYALKIATRYLTASKAQTALLVTGVAVGVFIFIFMSALIGGLAEFILSRTVGDISHVTIEAEVESISPATGAEFALLPPQNASGNWVKVVQRLPVRLKLATRSEDMPLRAGMTATVKVDTKRERKLSTIFGWGSVAAPASQRPVTSPVLQPAAAPASSIPTYN